MFLGIMPDLEHKSSVAVSHGHVGPIGKGHMAYNYHFFLLVMLQSLESKQGIIEPIHGFVSIGIHVAWHFLFFLLAFV